MIKTNFGTTEVKGSKATVKADLSIIAYTLKGNGALTKEEILEAVNRGLDSEFSEEETEDAALEALEVLKKMADLVDEVLKKGDKKDE